MFEMIRALRSRLIWRILLPAVLLLGILAGFMLRGQLAGDRVNNYFVPTPASTSAVDHKSGVSDDDLPPGDKDSGAGTRPAEQSQIWKDIVLVISGFIAGLVIGWIARPTKLNPAEGSGGRWTVAKGAEVAIGKLNEIKSRPATSGPRPTPPPRAVGTGDRPDNKSAMHQKRNEVIRKIKDANNNGDAITIQVARRALDEYKRDFPEDMDWTRTKLDQLARI